MTSRSPIAQFRDDPMAFIEALVIPSARGVARFADVMAGFQRERFAALCPSLLALARGEVPPIGRFWWEASKGCSKDSDLACSLLWLLAFSQRPLTIQVGAADADQADELRKAAKHTLSQNPWLAGRVEVQNWRIVCEATACEAEIIPADVAGSHGARPDMLVLNELSHISKWEFAQNLLDNASKVPRGLVVIATNAGFVGSPAYTLRELARESSRWSFHQFAAPAPWLDPDELAEAKRRNPPERFNRLFHGIWSTGTGNALTADDIEAAITLPGPHGRFDHRHDAYVAGLDLSQTRDRSALVVLGLDVTLWKVKLALVREWTPEQCGDRVSLAAVESEIFSVHQRLGLDAVLFDPWQCELMAQSLSHRGVRMLRWLQTPANLDLMARELLDAFRDREISLYRHESLLADLYELNLIERDSGYRLQSKRGKRGHADAAFALATALPTARAWMLEIAEQRREAAMY